MGLIERIAGHAHAHGASPALLHAHGDWSYRAFHTAQTDLAADLQARHLHSLALDLDNGPVFALSDLAAYAAGIAVLPLPPFFAPGQIQHALVSSGVDAVLTDDVERLRRRCPGIPVNHETETTVAGVQLHLLALATKRCVLPPETAKITYTSGTTGEPRGVLLTRAQIEAVTEALADATEARRADRCLALAPMSVLLENIGSLYVPLWAGATALLPPLSETGLIGAAGLDAARMHRGLHESRATGAIFSPQTLLGLVRALEGGAPRLECLRFAAVGGAPVSPNLLERAHRLGLPVFEGYGLSESGSVVTLNRPGANRPGSVGRPLPHVRVRIAADGEVETAGNLCTGYLDDAVPVLDAGWWRTGDLGRLDDDGFLFLEGRRRNVLITGFGRNVSPEWVESEIAQEPAVAQAAVFGEARPYLTALLLPVSGADHHSLTAAVTRANSRLPDYARVQRWLIADETFSTANGLLTGTGRLRREALQLKYGRQVESLYQEHEIS
jgi:long-subunit acyl-CoA synthetase (AMP-forming)